jgi:predicted ester cyclase
MTVTPRTLVERFYFEVWNQDSEAVAREILHTDFSFRGSLGPEKRGPEGFIEYLREVHTALENFTCVIEDLIVTDNRAAARMTFKGRHVGELFGVAPTGQEIRWAGAALFTTNDTQITALWVLGDVDGVKQQLGVGEGKWVREPESQKARKPES